MMMTIKSGVFWVVTTCGLKRAHLAAASVGFLGEPEDGSDMFL
jgi:hypothetical protein